MNREQLLTIEGIGTILRLAAKTAHSMAQAGELPTFKVRGQWRVRKVDFECWMADQAKPARPRKRSLSGRRS